MRATKSDKRPITDGARALRAYLDEIEVSVPAFCERFGINRYRVESALRGDNYIFTVDFGLAIERATKRRVKIAMWATETIRNMPKGALSRSNNRVRFAARTGTEG